MSSPENAHATQRAWGADEEGTRCRTCEFVAKRMALLNFGSRLRALPPSTMPKILRGTWNGNKGTFVPTEECEDGREEAVRKVTPVLAKKAMQDPDRYASSTYKYGPSEGSGHQLVVVAPLVERAASVIARNGEQPLAVVLATTSDPTRPLALPEVISHQWCRAFAQSISAFYQRSTRAITTEDVQTIYTSACDLVVHQALPEAAERMKYSMRWALDDALRKWHDRQTEIPAQETDTNHLAMVNGFLEDEICFLRHREDFLAEHNGQFVAIRDGQVLGYTPTRREMWNRGIVTPDRGAFVRKIEPQAFGPASSKVVTTMG